MRRGLFFLVLLAILSSHARADDAGLRTLATGDDSRGWQAVGRLNVGSRSFCTGSLIAPDLVLTAAHCMFDDRTGARIGDAEIEFLADWREGRASAYRKVRRSLVHPDFDFMGERAASRVAHDVAILELAHPIRNSSIQPFPTVRRLSRGSEVGVVSYAHDRAEAPSLQELCHVLAKKGGALILSCSVDFGSSGAPIFVDIDGQPHVVSLVSAKATLDGRPVALGASLAGPLADLMAMRKEEAGGAFGHHEPKVRRMSRQETQSATGAKFLRP